jgi:hypothetical protein
VQVRFPLLRIFRRRYCLANSRQPLIIGEHTRVSLIDEDRQLRSEVKTCRKKIVYLQM